MSAKAVTDLDFALACLKATEPHKPNFDTVAERLGCNKMTAYHRHWRLMKTLSESTDGVVAPASSVPKTPTSRGRKNKKAQSDREETVQADDHDADETPTKKKPRVSAPKSASKIKKEAADTGSKTKVKKEADVDVDDENDGYNDELAEAAVTALKEIVAASELE